jgi:putative ABC transport system permease protein
MNTLIIAWRNIFRNARRSFTTLLAIAISAVAVLLFGGFVATIIFGFETDLIRRTGHVQVFKSGYFEFGAGKPGSYGIDDSQRVMALIRDDPELKPLVRVVTPSLTLFGIAGNFEENASKTFFAHGVLPSDRLRMRDWDDYGFGTARFPPTALRDDDPEGGVVGVGMARMLHMCAALRVPECVDGPSEKPSPQVGDLPAEDFSGLIEHDAEPANRDARPKIDLLAATANGAPNVVSLRLIRAERQGVKEVDDNFVLMHLALAQRLLYGRSEAKVTAIGLQLHHTADIARVQAGLARLFAAHDLPLESRDFRELMPMFGQVIGMFGAIFGFIAVVMGVIVLFTVVNTMTMSVLERVAEIGTLRALGQRRSGIRRLFMAEGLVLGMVSATIGLGLGVGIAGLVNMAGLTWMPPNNVEPVPLKLSVLQHPQLMLWCWLVLVAITVLSSLLPANRAARMEVVDALRHV